MPVHDLIFCEPLNSKNSAEVLRAAQRIWVRILGLGLTVRRLHTDGGREFCNKQLDAWALARDLHHTYSVPSDPKSNGRIENWVKHAKSGIRTLLCSQKEKDTTHWPSALRQWAEQRLRQSLRILHMPDPIRPLPPFGTQVLVKNRQWTRKTPHDAKAMSGTVVCPAANIPNASVLVLENGQFYVAPVVYEGVMEPEPFHGQVANDIPPAPNRRIRGKTSDARGESGSRVDLEDSENAGFCFEGHGDVCPLEGCGDATRLEGSRDAVSGGEGCEEAYDEFEGMVPDLVLFDGVVDSPGSVSIDGVEDSESRVSLRNLWSEPMVRKLCEAARTHSWISDRCNFCGTWQGKILTREESEREAMNLLNKEGFISRCDLNHLLAVSLSGWTSTSRMCDREAAKLGSSGLTLGMYVYGSKVGLTRSCLERPNLTKLLNRYLKQNTQQATWTALRVTCNFEASPHRDRNAPGSLNIVAPISWFKEGKIWIEGEPPEGYEGSVVTRDYQGQPLRGYHVGGAHAVVQFDPSKTHSVEPSVGTRRVVVAYSPRLLDRLEHGDLCKLKELGFSVPSDSGADLIPRHDPTAQARGGERQEHSTTGGDNRLRTEGRTIITTGEEEHQAGFSPGGAGSNSGGWKIQESIDPESLDEAHLEFVKMRQLEIECRKLLDEQLELVLESNGEHDLSCDESFLSHVLEMKSWVHDLERWLVKHDALSKLRDGLLGCDEAVVLKARLRKMDIDPELGWQEDTWAPLTGAPLDELDEDLLLKEDVRPPGPKASHAIPAAPLQTISVSHKEVLEQIGSWAPSIKEELECVFERHGALQRTSQEQVNLWIEQGKVVEYLPSKALFHRKGGTGRQKTRIVACGNFDKSGSGSGEYGSTYAGGIDSTTLRIQLAHCGHQKLRDHSWTTGALDIRTAFLLAPLEQTNRILVLRPPKVLISAGIVHPQELWYATGAIYGLREAPAAWSSYRDAQLPDIHVRHEEEDFKLVRSKSDQNLWHLKPTCNLEAAPVALLGVYVDDMIGTGPRAILDSLFLAIQRKWETSCPQFASDEGGILFCGLEIHDSGDRLHIHQRKYLMDLLNRYPEVTGGASQPGLKEPDDIISKDQAPPDLGRLRLAQKLAGELLWIATKTRPDLIYVTSRIGQFITRNVEFAIQLAHNALRYLRSTVHYEIIYGGIHSMDLGPDVGPLQDRVGAVEAYADASFAPGNDRSQTGIVLVWNQVPITWLSMRQPCASLSTAESELQSSIDALALTEGFLPLIQELEPRPVKTFLYNDNQGAVTVMKIPQGSWRTRHLRLKAAWFFEQLETSRYAVYHLPGKYMLGDLCTKTLQSLRIKELLAMMRVNIVDSVEGESGSIGVKIRTVDSGGVPIKHAWEAPSKSTSELKNFGADSGGAARGSSE